MGINLHYASRGAATAWRMRAHMKRTGKTPRGHFLWSKEEDSKLRALYPDYKKLRKILRRRTYASLRHRARTLGIAKKRHIWTGKEISTLRRLYPEAPRSTILAEFPDLRWGQIAARARHAGFRRKRHPFNITGYALLDSIRKRAFELNISMVDLDDMARTKRYFQKAQWISSGVTNRGKLLRAIEAMDGKILIQWR